MSDMVPTACYDKLIPVKKIKLLEHDHLQIKWKKYDTVRTVPESNLNIVGTGSRSISLANLPIHTTYSTGLVPPLQSN